MSTRLMLIPSSFANHASLVVAMILSMIFDIPFLLKQGVLENANNIDL